MRSSVIPSCALDECPPRLLAEQDAKTGTCTINFGQEFNQGIYQAGGGWLGNIGGGGDASGRGSDSGLADEATAAAARRGLVDGLEWVATENGLRPRSTMMLRRQLRTLSKLLSVTTYSK